MGPGRMKLFPMFGARQKILLRLRYSQTLCGPTSSESSGLNGQALSTLSITRNLADALPYLQPDDSPRDLWIDAICINQRGDVEKSQQVNQMAQIYRRASRVIAWLGPADGDTRLAIETFTSLSSQIEVNFISLRIKAAPNANESWSDSTTDFPYDKATWTAIGTFLRSEWFERLWIWQEAHAQPGKTVMLRGHDTISWEDLRKAVVCLGKIATNAG
jgi:hypothetical protein